MSVSVESVESSTDEQWETHWQQCPYATYFHSPAWARIWVESAEAYRSDARLIRFTDGRSAVIPLMVRQRAHGKTYHSSAGGTFGGWVSADDLTPNHAQALVRWLMTVPNVKWRQNPYDPALLAASDHVRWSRTDFTQAIRYSVGLDKILATLRRNQVLRKVRQAREAGLECERTTDNAVWDEYYRIYQMCQDRWQDVTGRHSSRFFKAINLATEGVDFWIVRHGSELVAGAPLFKKGSFHVASWLALAHPAHLRLKPYELLYSTVIEHYGRSGSQIFDFNPSGGHQGVVAFKENFATERLPSHVYHARPQTYRVARLARGLLRRYGLWRHSS